MWRNSKLAVIDELDLPAQSTEVLMLDFSPIERAYYQRVLVESKESVRVAAKNEEDAPSMHSILLRLRQVCIHPQIGGQNSNALGRELLSLEDVLGRMISQRAGWRSRKTNDYCRMIG